MWKLHAISCEIASNMQEDVNRAGIQTLWLNFFKEATLIKIFLTIPTSYTANVLTIKTTGDWKLGTGSLQGKLALS